MPYSYAENEFDLWSNSENDSDNEEARHDNSGKVDDDDGNNNNDGLLEGYESDNTNFSSMQSSNTSIPCNVSCIGGSNV